jgi:hypothetical protein
MANILLQTTIADTPDDCRVASTAGERAGGRGGDE